MSEGLGFNGINKGAWSRYEDELLKAYIAIHGPRIHDWKGVPRGAGLNRDRNSCKNRWDNHLRPGIRKGNFTPEEDSLIMKMCDENMEKYNKPCWSKIAPHLSGRTAEGVRNRGIALLNAKRRPQGGGVHHSSSAAAVDDVVEVMVRHFWDDPVGSIDDLPRGNGK